MEATDLEVQDTVRGLSAGQKVFDRYLLKKIVGRGGMGVVWQASDEVLNRDVALKFLPDIVRLDQAALNDLKKETNRCLELTHPNIVRIYDLAHDEDLSAIAMEFVDGQTLSSIRSQKAEGILTTAEVASWLPHLGRALKYAHEEAKIAHRDLKPANMMLSKKGVLKLTDFGISRNLSDSISRVSIQGTSGGTIAYMSPQQAMGDVPSIKDDIYSLGALLYELLTSRPPFFSGDILAQLERKVPPPMMRRREELGIEGEEISPAWESAVAACLEKDPDKRPDSIKEVVDSILEGSVWERGSVAAGEATVRAVALVGAAAATEIDLDDQPTLPNATPTKRPPKENALAMTTQRIVRRAMSASRKQQIVYGLSGLACLLLFAFAFSSFFGGDSEKDMEGKQFAFKTAFDATQKMASVKPSAAAKKLAWEGFLSKHGEFENPYSQEDDKLLKQARGFVTTYTTASEAEIAQENKLEKQKEGFDKAFRDANARVERVATASEKMEIWRGFMEEYGSFDDPESVDDDSRIGIAKREMAKLEGEVEAEAALAGLERKFDEAKQDVAQLETIPEKKARLQQFMGEITVIPGKSAEVTKIYQQAQAYIDQFDEMEKSSVAKAEPIGDPGLEGTAQRGVPLRPEAEELDPEGNPVETEHAVSTTVIDEGAEPEKASSRDALFEDSKYSGYGEWAKWRILKDVQSTLKDTGYYKSSIDGEHGTGTHNAIVAYQRDSGITPTGRLDDVTLTKLGYGNVVQDNSAPPSEARSSGSSSGSSKNKGSRSRPPSPFGSGGPFGGSGFPKPPSGFPFPPRR